MTRTEIRGIAQEVSIRWPTLSAGAPLDTIIEQAARDTGTIPSAEDIRAILADAVEEHERD